MRKIIIILLVLVSQTAQAQKYKFGKVSKAELEEKFYPLDSTADAAVLYTERISHFDYSFDDGFVIVENYYSRIKIYNQEGFDKATKEILKHVSANNVTEEVIGIKARTYNLENGKIIKTKLKRKNIFKEKINKYYNSTKFTMPNLKPGSIVEWKFTKRSPFISMFDEVELQTDIPIKKLHILIRIPEYFEYNKRNKGYLSIPLKTSMKKREIEYYYAYLKNQQGGYQTEKGKSKLKFFENKYNLDMNNIPAIKEEPYSGNINNYKSGILFELSLVRYPQKPAKAYSSNWESVVEKIYENSSFGNQIKKNKHFRDDLNNALQGVTSPNEKINKIFQFTKSKIKWNGYYSIYSDEGVKNAYKKSEGNIADINLNLVAMLQYAGLDANPVLVSTISHGIPIFPTRHGFNYVIAAVKSPEGLVLLDASGTNNLPNILPRRVLNFQGRLIKKDGKSEWIKLYPSKHAISKTIISVKMNEMGISGVARKTLTKNMLLNYREEAREKSKDDLIKWIDENYKDIEVIKARVSNLDNLEKDAIENIQFESESFIEEIDGKIYLNPLLYKQISENQFKSKERLFPVYYDYPRAYIDEVNITIPENFIVESIPESAELLLPDDLGFFKYTILQEGLILKVKSSLVINKAVIPANYYTDLKKFYNKIIVKEAEKIVLHKN